MLKNSPLLFLSLRKIRPSNERREARPIGWLAFPPPDSWLHPSTRTHSPIGRSSLSTIPDNDPTLLDHNRRFEEYQRLQQMANAKIFDLYKLSYISVNIDGYDSKGVTQCYFCNKFNYTADNCHLVPRCLKCGEKHQIRDCQIKHVEQAYCINCQVFGHIANYAKCPLYPKPRKGSTTNNKNNYTSIDNSIIRLNVSYAQATNNTTSSNNIKKQMAPQVKGNPPISTQTQASRATTTPQQVNTNQNSNAALITQTLQGIIQALSTLTTQISNMNFNDNIPQEKHCPDVILIQEAHPRPNHRININNYHCYRNDRITKGSASGGIAILNKNTIPHFTPSPPALQYIEATLITLNPPNINPLTITSIYVPPYSDKYSFTLDLENIIQINSNVGFLAILTPHTMRGIASIIQTEAHKNFAELTDLEIAFPNTTTRYGFNTSNTLDIALIINYNFPYNISSLSDLSSNHSTRVF
ncbi:hypothetical protein TNCV_1175071 [Trichonephila clavipes]|nr:hypothetical protein TNCV_1175071 [Trichonephila clavipes]